MRTKLVPPPQPTIGVFDSGFGGLTVLRALLQLLPNANYIYLGDTARLPYGSKSRETIARYAVSSARFLQDHGAELLVVACNTATALALDDIKQALSIPVIGVVEPGAQAALVSNSDVQDTVAENRVAEHPIAEHRVAKNTTVENTVVKNATEESEVTKNNVVILSEAKNPRISLAQPPASNGPQVLVLATAATVQSHAYTQALKTLNLEAHEKACPLLVPLVEEGWINHPVTDEVLKIYLNEALNEAPNTQTLLLGCTHYPLIEPAIHRTLATLNHPLNIIDSAQATAQAVVTHLNQAPAASQNSTPSAQNCRFYATDSIEKFERLGSAFLGQPVTGVRLVDLGG